MKTRYLLVARYPGQTQEWIAFESKNLKSVEMKYNTYKTDYSHFKIKIIKQTEEVIRK